MSLSKTLFLYFFCILVNYKLVIGQDIILKTDNYIAPFYTLEEWVYSNSNWNFDSYDFKNIIAFTPHFSSYLENGIALYINGEQYLTSWLGNTSFNFPEISFTQIDSIVVSPYQKVTDGNYTPNGSIHIFLKDLGTSGLYDIAYVNQVNDPGLNYENEFRTSNVERVSDKKYHVLTLQDFFNTTLLYNVEFYSRTNSLAYNRINNPVLVQRTRIQDDSGDIVIQRNRETAFILKNTLETSQYTLNLTSSLTSKSQHYQWHALSGIEVPYIVRTFQTGAKFKIKKIVFIRILSSTTPTLLQIA